MFSFTNFILPFLLIMLALLACTWLLGRVSARKAYRAGLRTACNAMDGLVATHANGQLTRLASAAISERFLLGEKGADAEHVAPCNAVTDFPYCIITDEAEAADRPVNCALLGNTTGTLKVRVNEAIAFGDELVPGALSRARKLPAAAGTYYVIGRSLGAAVAGELVEFIHQVPQPRTVA